MESHLHNFQHKQATSTMILRQIHIIVLSLLVWLAQLQAFELSGFRQHHERVAVTCLNVEDAHYASSFVDSRLKYLSLVQAIQSSEIPVWEQVKLEAHVALGQEPAAGPQIYQGILSQHSLVEAVVSTISHEIETALMPATAIKNLFLKTLAPDDKKSIFLDIIAVAMRSPSVGNCLTATLFHKGFHALVCYRVGHRLWLEGRTGLAYYMQSTVSRKYSADIHPAAKMGSGIYLNSGGGIVIGETAVVGEGKFQDGATLESAFRETDDWKNYRCEYSTRRNAWGDREGIWRSTPQGWKRSTIASWCYCPRKYPCWRWRCHNR
jgi:serine O-acetyltransferase